MQPYTVASARDGEYTEPTPGTEMGWRLRRKPGERNERPFEDRAEGVRRIKPRIIARYDRKSENE